MICMDFFLENREGIQRGCSCAQTNSVHWRWEMFESAKGQNSFCPLATRSAFQTVLMGIFMATAQG